MKIPAGLLLLLVPSLLFAAPDLGVQIYPSESVEPGSSALIFGRVGNIGDAEAFDVKIDIHFPPAYTFERVVEFYGWECTSEPGAIHCRSIGMEPGDSYFTFNISTPPQRDFAAFIPITATVTSASPDADPGNNHVVSHIPMTRFIDVTSAADSGPGTLRAAIELANEVCDGQRLCRIEIFVPGIPRIELLTPLPPITGHDIVLFSNAQWSEQLHTMVELSGARLKSGDGLVLRSRVPSRKGITIQGFVINGFPGNGILIDGAPLEAPTTFAYTLERNAIGTDLTGTRAIPNGLRGIAINAPRSVNFFRDNLISGNGRSGIAIYSATSTQLWWNRIGTKPRTDEPLPNGASGIHIGANTRETSITGGMIAFHPDFGLAIERGAEGVALHGGAKIVQNTSLDIDWNLDGPSLGAEDVLQPPVISTARYDAGRDVTVVTGQMPPDASFGPYMAAVIMVADSTNRFGITPYDIVAGGSQTTAGSSFLVEVRGDLRGKYVSAQTVSYLWPDVPPFATSELGLAVQVQ
jgi:hypothetical protein